MSCALCVMYCFAMIDVRCVLMVVELWLVLSVGVDCRSCLLWLVLLAVFLWMVVRCLFVLSCFVVFIVLRVAWRVLCVVYCCGCLWCSLLCVVRSVVFVVDRAACVNGCCL